MTDFFDRDTEPAPPMLTAHIVERSKDGKTWHPYELLWWLPEASDIERRLRAQERSDYLNRRPEESCRYRVCAYERVGG